MKVIIGASSFAATDKTAIEMLTSAGIDVVPNPYGRKMNEEEIIDLAKDAVGILAGLEPLNEKVFLNCPKLKAIARIGIGIENVDIDAAKKMGIKVSNTPSAPTYAVAEMVFAVLLSIIRNIIPANNDMHNKIWAKRIGMSLKGLTVLLVGYGRIAETFSSFLKPFGVNILISDIYKPDISTGALKDEIQKADVVSLHASGQQTIITQTELDLMKKGAIILNSARGNLVDENAIYNALKSGHLAYYWSDVFVEEPYSGPLTNLDNAILTPHISTYTMQCRKEMEMQSVKNLLKDLNV